MVKAVRFASAKEARAAGVRLPVSVRNGSRASPAKRKRRPKAVIEKERAQARAATARAEKAEAEAKRTAERPEAKRKRGVQVAQPYGQVIMAMLAIGLLYLTNAQKWFVRLKEGEPLV